MHSTSMYYSKWCVTASSREIKNTKSIKARQTRAGARGKEWWRLVNSQSPSMNDWVRMCGTGHMGWRGATDALPPLWAPCWSASRNESKSVQCHTPPSTLLLLCKSQKMLRWWIIKGVLKAYRTFPACKERLITLVIRESVAPNVCLYQGCGDQVAGCSSSSQMMLLVVWCCKNNKEAERLQAYSCSWMFPMSQKAECRCH